MLRMPTRGLEEFARHLVGASQGGYINEIRVAIGKQFPGLSNEQREELTLRIDRANTVTACSFCNATYQQGP